tara:strand:+ start:86 stop:712 length:627 start_codon:yes stop_codon:yes gene_type:complete
MAQNEVIKTRSISDFKGRLTGGGVRPNLFEVSMTLPDGEGFTENLQSLVDGNYTNDAQTDFRFLCKAANLPASNVASIEVPFRGRLLKVSGDRTIDPWTITIINDQNFTLRKVFENWAQNMAQYADASGLTNPDSYMGNADVYQLGRTASTKQTETGTGGSDASILAQYKFQDIFPTAISAIDLSYDTENTIEEFTVDFAVNYYYPVK